MDWDVLCSVLRTWGPIGGVLIALLVFFMWKDWWRERKLQQRVEVLEREQRDVILPLVQQCATVITQNTVVMQRLERALDQKNQALSILERMIDKAE
jgi:phosphate/sulfate permease